MKRRELEVRWRVRDCGDSFPDYNASKPVRGPDDLQAYLAPLAAQTTEALWVVILNVRMCVQGHREVTRGTLHSTTAPTAEVLQAALWGGGAAFILAHNHPSGDTTPSSDDIEATARIAAGATAIGLPLLDHVVCGLGTSGEVITTSLKSRGLMPA